MPLVALKYYRDWLAASPTGGLVADSEGRAFLAPNNESPNPTWLEVDELGSMRGWAIERGEYEVGWYPLVTQGAANPLNTTLTRQTSTYLNLGKDSWTAKGPIALGYMPEFAMPSSLPKPDTPIVEAVLRTKKGFPAGFYGAAYGLRDEFGHRTPVSGISVSEAAIGEGQAITFYVPQGLIATGARYVDLYLTKAAATANAVNPVTLRFQETIDLYHSIPLEWVMTGPYRSGRKPVDENRTGLTPPQPKIGGKHADIDIAKAPHDLQPGSYRFAYQYVNERGSSFLGPFSEVREIGAVRENKGFYIAGPLGLPRGVGWIPWLQINRNGLRLHYRILRSGGRQGDSQFFEDRRRRHKDRIIVYGVTDDILSAAADASEASTSTEDSEKGDKQKKKRTRVIRTGPYVLVEESRPDEDTTIIEAPDVSGGPDPPVGTGQVWPTVGVSYRGAVSMATSTSQETRRSNAAKAYLRTSGEGGPDTLRITPVSPVNKLANATFSENSPPNTANAPSGTPADWTITGVSGAAFANVDDGTLTLGTTSTVDASPTAASKLWALPEGDMTTFTVMGSMTVTATTAGTARLILDQFTDDDLVNPVTSTVILSIVHPNTGSRTLDPYGLIYGPGGIALTAGAAYVRLRAQGLKTTSSWNQNIEFFNLGIFPFGAALRKGNRRPNEYAEYDLPRSTAYPEQAEYFLGPPALPPGAETIPPVEPLSILDFTSGFTADTNIADGSVIGGWTFQRNVTSNTSLQMKTSGGPITASNNLLIQDDNTTGGSAGLYAEKDFVGLMSGKSQAIRVLMKVSRLPTKGEHIVAQILTTGGTRLGILKLTSAGALTLYRYLSDALVSPGKTVLSGIAAGDILDYELAASNEVDGEGILRGSAGKNGPRSTTVTYSGVDWGTASPRWVRAGEIVESDATSKCTYRLDNIVATTSGDVLDRETPAVPTGVTPPEPDRPLYPTWLASTAQVEGSRVIPTTRNGFAYEVTTAGTSTGTEPTWASALTQGQSVTQNGVQYTNVGSEFREYDVDGNEIPQLWHFDRPGGAMGGVWGPYTEEVVEVIPGEAYTNAIQGRHAIFETNPDVDAPLPFHVTLYGEGLDPLPVGSPYDSSAGAVGTEAWGAEDYYHIIDVPATDVDGNSYTEARIECLNKHGALFVWQEHLFTKGEYTTQAARDARRRYLAEEEGAFTAILDSRCPEVSQGGMALGNRWRSLGVVTDTDGLPAGNTIDGVTFRSSDTDSFSGALETDSSLVVARRYLEVKGTLNGDGRNSPSIPPTGVYLSIEKIEPTILRPDYSEFSAGTFLEGLEIPPLRHEYSVITEAGEVFASAISDEKQFLKPFVIHVFSQEALEELEETPPNGLLGIESAMLDGTGLRLLIHPAQVIDFASEPVTAKVLPDDSEAGDLKRFVHATTTIERAEIVARGPLW